MVILENNYSVQTDEINNSQISYELKSFENMGLFYLIRSLPYIENKYDFSSLQYRFRFGQSAYLAFQNKQVNRIFYKKQSVHIDIKGFGLLGPNGGLPLHISEMIYEKYIYQKDRSLNDFLDIFNHRLIELFYKSWYQSQDVISLDRKDNWTFSRYISSLIGADEQQDKLDYIHHYQRLFFSNFLLNKNLPVQNLQQVLNFYFKMPVSIVQNIGQWIDAQQHVTKIGRELTLNLGQGLLIGERIYDAMQRFCVQIGPISTQQYIKFLHQRIYAKQLEFWVEQYAHYQYQWEIEVIIDKEQIEPFYLGSGIILGETSWIGKPNENPRINIRHYANKSW